MNDHATIETAARMICDDRNGVGHYAAKGTKRAHWRRKARLLLAVAQSNPTATALFRACGWPA